MRSHETGGETIKAFSGFFIVFLYFLLLLFSFCIIFVSVSYVKN